MAIDVQTTRIREYKDLNLSLTRNPVTGDITSVSGADAVKRSLRNLLLTSAGEIPFFPQFGTRLNRLLFEPIDAITTSLIESEIRATIIGYEPRVIIQTLTVTPTEDEQKYQVDMVVEIVNLPQPVTLTIFLSRLR